MKCASMASIGHHILDINGCLGATDHFSSLPAGLLYALSGAGCRADFIATS
jgi:hypothetical protein